EAYSRLGPAHISKARLLASTVEASPRKPAHQRTVIEASRSTTANPSQSGFPLYPHNVDTMVIVWHSRQVRAIKVTVGGLKVNEPSGTPTHRGCVTVTNYGKQDVS